MSVHVNDKYLEGAPDNDPFRNKNITFLKDGDGCFVVETNGPEGSKPKIRLDLRILSETFAKRCPVGTARNEPNLDPFLPPPVGRIQWTLDPCKMLVSYLIYLSLNSLEPTNGQKNTSKDLVRADMDCSLRFVNFDDTDDQQQLYLLVNSMGHHAIV